MLTLSKSRINAYIQCPERYRLNYELEIKPLKTAFNMVEGSCLHHLIQSALLYGKHIHVDDVIQIASERFWEDTPFDNIDYLTEENYQIAQRKCLSEAKVYLDQIGEIEVTSAEKYLTAPLIDPITQEEIPDISLHGYVDLIDVVNGENRVIDIKTVSKRPQVGTANVSLELSLYGYLQSYPKFNNQQVALMHLVRTKDQKVIWDESLRTMHDYADLLNLCKIIADNINNQRFYKNIGFSCNMCGYKSLCWQDYETATETFGKSAVEYYQMERELYQSTMFQEVAYAIS